MIQGKKILITGGAGFIGWSLAQALENNHVVILDHLSNPSVLFEPTKFEFYNDAVENIFDVLGVKKFDYIFHFGEYSRVEQSLDQFQNVFDQNVKQFPHILKYCKDSGAKLIYSGSSSVFSDMPKPQLLSPYTLFKKINCDLLEGYANWYDLEYAICYFSNVYGPGECSHPKNATLIQKYIDLVSNGAKTLPVTGDGTQVREFTHVDDTVDALLKIAALGHGDGYCITSSQKISINEVTNMFGVKPKYIKSSIANRKGTSINAQKVRDLGWQPNHELADYIRRTI